MTVLRPLSPVRASPPLRGAPVAATLWRLRGAAIAVLLGLLLTAQLLPVRIPFLLDYPNHLARMHVLATGAADPALHAMYRVVWAFIPNMLMDLVVPPLAHVLPLTVAGKLFIALAMLLPAVGVVALHRAWFRVRSWWPWIAVLPAVNACLVLGFLNYVTGVGLALLGAAWHARRRDRGIGWPAVAGTALLGVLWGVACLLAHIVAFGLLVLLMLSTEAASGLRRPLVRRLAPIVATALVPLVLYRAFGPGASYASGGALALAARQILEGGLLSQPYFRARWLFAAATGETEWIGAVAVALMILPVLWSAWQRRLAVAPQMMAAVAVLAVLYAVLPPVLVDNGMVYERLSLPLALLAIAGLHPRLAARPAAALALAVVALVGVRSAVTWRLGTAQEALLRQVEHVIAPIPSGARVLAVRDGRQEWDVEPDERKALRILGRSVDYQHLPALVTLERNAFWPMIFTAAGKQPLQVRALYAAGVQSDGLLPLTSQLGPTEDMPAPSGPCAAETGVLPCQLYSWPGRYDFLLRLNAHAAPPPGAAHLQEVARDGWAVLYRVL